MSNILWISVIWIAPLMSFLLANEAKFKKNIVSHLAEIKKTG